MSSFFTFFQNYRSGILLFIFVLFAGAFLLQWLAWIFARGRFTRDAMSTTGTGTGDGSVKPSGFVLTEAAVKIINEFRHLLALLIIVIFAFALAYSLIKAGSLTTGDAITNLKGALEGVVATLGGLVGSIIGYYFGESSKTNKSDASEKTVQQQPPPTDATATGTGVTGAPPIVKDPQASTTGKQQPSSAGGTSTGS
ncbi:MAG TPA: hypothetical protein VF397_03605 [Pyrinomonadaceae bacterium]